MDHGEGTHQICPACAGTGVRRSRYALTHKTSNNALSEQVKGKQALTEDGDGRKAATGDKDEGRLVLLREATLQFVVREYIADRGGDGLGRRRGDAIGLLSLRRRRREGRG